MLRSIEDTSRDALIQLLLGAEKIAFGLIMAIAVAAVAVNAFLP